MKLLLLLCNFYCYYYCLVDGCGWVGEWVGGWGELSICLPTLVHDHVPQEPCNPSSIIKFRSNEPDGRER